MKRDMDLIREILLQMEATPAYKMWVAKPLLDHDIKDVVAHIQLAQEAGLLEASFSTGPFAIVNRLCNDGYDFLEQSKSLTLWESAKAKIQAEGLPISISILSSIMTSLVKEKLLHLK